MAGSGRVGTVALGVLGIVLATGPARAEMPVTFPPGWTVSELPGPTVDGHVTAGSRRRALMPGPGGKPLAVIELTEEKVADGDTVALPDVVRTARETMTTDYAGAGLDDRCADPAPARAGTWDGTQLDCTVYRKEAAVLHQVIAMWKAPGAVYSLSYTAPTSSGRAGEAEFAQVLASVGAN